MQVLMSVFLRLYFKFTLVNDNNMDLAHHYYIEIKKYNCDSYIL